MSWPAASAAEPERCLAALPSRDGTRQSDGLHGQPLETRDARHAERNDRKQWLAPQRACDREMPHPDHHVCVGQAIRRHAAHIGAAGIACTRQFALCRLTGPLRASYPDPTAISFWRTEACALLSVIFLVDNGLLPRPATAQSLATLFPNCTGISMPRR